MHCTCGTTWLPQSIIPAKSNLRVNMLHATSGSQPAPAQWSLPASTTVLNTRHVTHVGLPAVLLLHDACRHSCCCCTHREHDRLPARAAVTAAAAADTLHKALPEASPSPAAATKGLIRLQMCCLQRKAVIPRQQRQSATPHTPTPTLSQPTFL